VRAELSIAEDVVPGQQVKLSIDIETDRWFAGGTRIEIPEVRGLVILQTETFASNSSENRAGKNWVTQRWTLDVYAQYEGHFTIPPIEAHVEINEANNELIGGLISGPPLTLSAVLPESLHRAETWIAAPQFSVNQSFDSTLDDLSPGDAIERKIRFDAVDVMAMMLPTFTEPELKGLKIYPEPPVLNNSSNRGVTYASRELTLRYIAEAEGEYQLPAQEYFWWDTQAKALELLSLPAVSVKVGKALSSGSVSSGEKGGLRRLLLWLLVAAPILYGITKLTRLRTFVSALAFTKKRWKTLNHQWRRVRQPALPQRLNPGNSSEE